MIRAREWYVRPVELPQVPDTATVSIACDCGQDHCAVVALRAAVEAGTQGVLGPPTVCRVADLFVTLRPPLKGFLVIPVFSVFHVGNSITTIAWTHSSPDLP